MIVTPLSDRQLTEVIRTVQAVAREWSTRDTSAFAVAIIERLAREQGEAIVFQARNRASRRMDRVLDMLDADRTAKTDCVVEAWNHAVPGDH